MEQTPTFEEAYAQYRRKVRYICLRMLQNENDADDLVQEVFMQLHRKIHLFKGESLFSTWLHRLTVNVVLMKLRGNRARFLKNAVSLEEMAENDEESGAGRSLDKALLVEDGHLLGAASRITINRVLENMPVGYRLVCELHDIQGFEHHEIAVLLGCSIGNSKSQLSKARKWLAEAIGVEYREDDQSDVGDLLSGFDKWLAEV